MGHCGIDKCLLEQCQCLCDPCRNADYVDPERDYAEEEYNAQLMREE